VTEIEVKMGEYQVLGSHENLSASGIGSCVVITLYDPRRQIGGMAHAMLPENIPRQIEDMLYKMYSLACSHRHIEAKLVGGANMFPGLESEVGLKNISIARRKLKDEGVKLVGESVGGSMGRSVEFCTGSGIVTVKIKF
jgi:chemotaxis protein CheD